MQNSSEFLLVPELTQMVNEMSQNDSRIVTDWKKDGANTMMLVDEKAIWRSFEIYGFMWKV